jgi:hypothetical protein
MSTHATRAPRITTTALRAVLSTRDGLALWLPSGDVEAAPTGLTKAQATDPSLVVILTHAEAVSFLAATDGEHRAAAVAATATLAWQHRMGFLSADDDAAVTA